MRRWWRRRCCPIGAALPAGAGGRAERGGHDQHPARAEGALRGPPRGADQRCVAGGGGGAVRSERRFQPVLVGEPSVEDTISILRGLKERYEVHHGVRIKDASLVAAAVL